MKTPVLNKHSQNYFSSASGINSLAYTNQHTSPSRIFFSQSVYIKVERKIQNINTRFFERKRLSTNRQRREFTNRKQKHTHKHCFKKKEKKLPKPNTSLFPLFHQNQKCSSLKWETCRRAYFNFSAFFLKILFWTSPSA